MLKSDAFLRVLSSDCERVERVYHLKFVVSKVLVLNLAFSDLNFSFKINFNHFVSLEKKVFSI